MPSWTPEQASDNLAYKRTMAAKGQKRHEISPTNAPQRVGTPKVASTANPKARKPQRGRKAKKSGYNTAIVLAYFEECGLPMSVPEFKFHPLRRWRFDFAWISEMVALEVEGGIWTGGRHVRGKGFEDDMEKYNSAAVIGFRVLRVAPENLCMQSTVDMIKTAIK